jgi:3-phosphoshikimate 1-carboxyvinyltransferase
MPETIELSVNNLVLRALPQLPLSKSLSNRHIMLHAVSGGKIALPELSDAHDTKALLEIIKHLPSKANAGDGGTTFRFALAYLAALPGYEGILTGTSRLCERPQQVLIDGLRALGADIQCLDREGFAPVSIRGRQLRGGELEIDASVSSQYASALMLIAPMMEQPLNLRFRGELVSLSYLKKTQIIMQQGGVEWDLSSTAALLVKNALHPFALQPEADWTAASYWYSFAALAERADVNIKLLKTQSVQGDRTVAEVFRLFGIESVENQGGMQLLRTNARVDFFRFNAVNNPDIVQTLVVTCVGLKIPFEITGLQTLVNKETNRIDALCKEMAKLNVQLEVEENKTLSCMNPQPDFSRTLVIETYNDHRMAMAFAPLVYKVYTLAVRNPSVVDKSYPNFWRDVREAGVNLAMWDD